MTARVGKHARITIPESVWRSLPMAFRQKWWESTNYGNALPSVELYEELKNFIDTHSGDVQQSELPQKGTLTGTEKETT